MMLRPTPGCIRAVMHAAGKARSRPRPASVLTPHIRSSASRGFHSSTSATRAVRSSSALTALLRRVLSSATRAAQLAPHRFASPHKLFSALRAARASYKVQSPLLKGAIDAFRSTAQRTSAHTTTKAYSSLNSASVKFSRGTLSGLGARPAARTLGLSPLRGGVGLQTARKFSSGGARVFDNLIVNAPLALRLAGDEVEDKAKLAKRLPASTRRTLTAAAGARRTGSTFSSAALPRNALLFATSQKSATSASCSTASDSEADFDLYFQFPELALPTPHTVVTLRLIDALHDALGGRAPSAASNPHHPRLFDAAFLLDARTALAYEHRRYLRAKAVLRVLWDAGVVEEMDVADEGVWTVRVRGGAEEVRQMVSGGVGFDVEAWCAVEGVQGEEEGWEASQSGQGSFEHVSTPELSSVRSTGDEVSLDEAELISLPESASSSSVLFDSRTSF
ncbi:uncharacterized protein SRS1_15540 [Sporisorium reilianum f. sp. reilianum]|uniref:Uncharacterized protein n=1 Tax=Sporisorium reilianum f. sp. reilianum TaxID=72559 RepID=A0A2N8UJQ2_9BASI|nr:uncharacterized protein SRS1_15540 [Sporisorium reilianum f. sp. reilianum]